MLKPMHLQTCYNLKATDSTKDQIDHVLFRRRDIKAVQDTRVFRGADFESNHRLMLCNLQLKFRKQKHTFHPCLQLAPLHSEAGKHSSYPCRTCWPPTSRDVKHSWGALKSSLNTTARAQLKQPTKPQKPWTSEATLHLANRKRKPHWPVAPLMPRLSTRLPTEMPTSQTIISISPPCSQRCNTPCARAIHIQYTRLSGSSAMPDAKLAGSCDMGSLAGSCIQIPSALLNGFSI